MNKSVRVECLQNKTTAINREDVVLWHYALDGSVVRSVLFEDVPRGRAETSKRAAIKTLTAVGYDVIGEKP